MTASNSSASGNRKWMVIAGVVVAIVVAVLIAVSASGGDDSGGDNLAGVDDAVALFAGIPQKGLEIGTASAPVTIVEYLDVQCPFCANAATGIVPKIVTQYVKTGQAKLKLQPIAFIGDDSEKGALVVIAAAEQNRAAEFVDILFANQGAENSGWLTDGMVSGITTALKLDAGKLDDARGSDATRDALDAIAKAARTDSVQSTPTFVVKGPKGQYEIQNRENIAEFAQAIAAVQ